MCLSLKTCNKSVIYIIEKSNHTSVKCDKDDKRLERERGVGKKEKEETSRCLCLKACSKLAKYSFLQYSCTSVVGAWKSFSRMTVKEMFLSALV